MSLQQLLDKTQSTDADLRYMAVNDLIGQMDAWQTHSHYETLVKDALLRLLSDTNKQVVNLVATCLGHLSAKASEEIFLDIVKNLSALLNSSDGASRDIASLALKTVLGSAPITNLTSVQFTSSAIPELSKSLSNDSVVLDVLDILSELLSRIQAANTKDYPIKSLINPIQTLLAHSRFAVRKRAISTLVTILRLIPDEVSSVVHFSCDELTKTTKSETQRTYFGLLSSLSRLDAKHVIEHIPTMTGLAIKPIGTDDELSESAMQLLETLFISSTSAMASLVPQSLEIASKCIEHDPNYVESEDEEMAEDIDEEMSGDDEAYSDDEDLSWKVRKAAAKLISAIVANPAVQLSKELVFLMIKRVRDREESVKLEVMSTLLVCLKKIPSEGFYTDVIKFLTQAFPKQLVSNSIQVKKSGLAIIQQLAHFDAAGFVEHQYSSYYPFIESIFKSEENGLVSNSSELKLLALDLISSLSIKKIALEYIFPYRGHEKKFSEFVSSLLPIFDVLCAKPSYKVTCQAFRIIRELFNMIPTESPLFRSLLTALNGRVINNLMQDYDTETKQEILALLGVLITRHSSVLDNDACKAYFSWIFDKASIESTRIAALKCLRDIYANPIPNRSIFDEFGIAAFDLIIPFLKLSSPETRLLSVSLLSSLFEKGIPSRHEKAILASEPLAMLLKEPESNLFDQTLAALSRLIDYGILNLNVWMNQVVIPLLISVAETKPKFIKNSKQIGTFLEKFARDSNEGDVESVVNRFVEIGKKQSIENLSPIVECVASVAVHDQIKKTVLSGYSGFIQGDLIYFGLLGIKSMAKKSNVAAYNEQIPPLIISLISNGSDDIKTEAAYILGYLAIQDAKFIANIVEMIHQCGKPLHMALIALVQFITHRLDLHGKTEDIWDLLFDILERFDVDDAVRNLISECLAKICQASRMKSDDLITRMQGNPRVKACSVGVLRYIDEITMKLMNEAILLMRDEDINVRKAAITAIRSVALRKSDNINYYNLRNDIMPALYEAMVIREDLIRVVDMGPFKHKIDDGLDTRKSAYECALAIKESYPDKINLSDLASHLLQALSDSAQEIKSITHISLQKIILVAPEAVSDKVPAIVEPLKNDITKKAKANAVKQELERLTDSIRSALKLAFLLSKKFENLSLEALLREARNNDSSLYKEVEDEVMHVIAAHSDAIQVPVRAGTPMDTQ